MVKRKVRQQPNNKPNPANDSSSRFQMAMGLHEQGSIERAEILYREILQSHPSHFDTLLFLGHLYLHSGRAQQAIEVTSRSLVENPHHPAAHFNLGLALLNLGQNESAIESFDRAIALMPAYSEAYCNRGIAMQNLGQHQEAIASFERTLECMPENGIAYSNRGISLQKLVRHPEAITSFDKALELDPRNGVAHNNRGISLLALKKHAEALVSFERALELMPDYAEACSNRGLALQHLGRYEDAIASFDRAIELCPDNGMAFCNRGTSLLKLGRDEEAMASLDKALGATPDSAEVFINRGLVLKTLGRFQEALACFDQTLALRQAHVSTLNNRGNVLRDLNRSEEALASYDEALKNEPEDAITHFNASMCRLSLGDFGLGWEEYEWRWQIEQFSKAKRNFQQPLWLGKESLRGKTILLHAEQGLGDTIQFCRYAQQVNAQGATVLLEVPPVLKSALLGLEGVSQVLGKGELLPAFDYHCPLMSLPLALNTDLASIPASPRYLKCDTQHVAKWRSKLGATTLPRVGLVWSGNADFANDRTRSIPLEIFINLLSEQAQFVSLQRDIRPADQPFLDAHQGIVHLGDQLHDFADTAALVENMDLVIAVDTAVAHLAGALGKPVWILLPFNSDWRWLLKRNDSPWYPSARLIRQSRSGDWGEVIEQLALELDELRGELHRYANPYSISS